MYVPAVVLDLSVGPSHIIAYKSKPFVFCTFRTLFKSAYPSHSIGLTASSAQNIISRLFIRLRTLLKTGSPANLFESEPCTLLRKNTGGRGVRTRRLLMIHLNLRLSMLLLLRHSTFDIRPASSIPHSRLCPGGERETSFFGRCLGFTVQVHRHQQGRPTARAFWAES